jgi:hypothetical protein
MPRAHDAEHPHIPARQPVDRDRRRRRRAQRGQQVAPHHGAGLPGLGIEQEDAGLVVDQPLRGIAGEIATGLHAQLPARPVEPGLEPVLPPLAQRLAHHREIIGLARAIAAKVASTAAKASSGETSSAISASGMISMHLPGKPGPFLLTEIPRGSGGSAPGPSAMVRDGGSIGLAARRDRPDHLDLAAAHADIPVMHVAGRVAVAGHQAQLVVDPQHARRVFDTPCSSLHLTYFTSCARRPPAGPLSTDCAFSPASTIALSALAWLITLVRMNSAFSHSPWSMRLPSLSRMRP